MSESRNIETLSSVILEGLRAFQTDIHTCLPCIVESFDSVKQTVEVQPVVKRVFIDSETGNKINTDLPLLINVPILYPKGGGFSLTFPIKKGDECLVFFAERSIDDWYDTGEIRLQNQKRFHDLSDGVAFVGLTSKPNVLSDYKTDQVQLRNDSGTSTIAIQNNGLIKIKGAVEVEGSLTVSEKVVAQNGVDITGDLDTQGNVTSTGTVQNNSSNIGSTHTHPQANDSGGNTEQPTGIPV